jgi:hypothetical protein
LVTRRSRSADLGREAFTLVVSVPAFPQEHEMAERVRVREISNDEGNRLLRMVRRDSGSVVTWRRAQMVLLSAQGMDVAMIAEVTFTSPDRVLSDSRGDHGRWV